MSWSAVPRLAAYASVAGLFRDHWPSSAEVYLPVSGTITALVTRAPAAGAAAISPSTYEINAFCSAIRCDTALNCGPEKASHSASWTIAANEALKSGQMTKIL